MSEPASAGENLSNEEILSQVQERLDEISARSISDNADISAKVEYIQQFLKGGSDEVELTLPKGASMTDNWLHNLVVAVEGLVDDKKPIVPEKRSGWENNTKGHLFSISQSTVVEGVSLIHSFRNDGTYGIFLSREVK